MQPPDPKQLGRYFALAQVGLEMVAPIGLGWLIFDYFLGLAPWGSVSGAVLGLVGGVAHLVVLANRKNDEQKKSP